ncbi:MAG TPA: hypothetical protein VK995_04145 [Oceanipulchritudo sp.]|nr:hypothetical protein [Oceanipulchritudo sp.]
MVEKTESAGIPARDFKVGSSRFRIAPEHGFRLMQWTVSTVQGNREILHWPANTEDLSFANIRGGNPLLFPFSGRSFDRGVENAWRAPGGERLPMPRHGFARDGAFRICEQSDNHIAAELLPSEIARAAYPYDYTFRAACKFEELAFTITLTLENHGETAIPWSAGHHFYFNLPWHAGARRKDYRLNMEARKCAYHGPDGKLVMQKERETCHDLSDTALLDRIHWQLRHNRVSFGPKGGEEDVHLIIGSDPVPPKGYALVTWSESTDAPYYCIEPWMGPPNAAEHGKGLHWVGAGESGTFTIEVSLF